MRFARITASILGISAVVSGAFGAHALKNELAAKEMTQTWQTACLYHLIHALAVLVVAVAAGSTGSARYRGAVLAWLAGVLLFSGSLYGLALGGPRWLGPVTPLGGVAFIVGWALIAWPGKTEA